MTPEAVIKWQCSFHLILFGCLLLKPNHHVVRKPKPHGEDTGKCSHWLPQVRSWSPNCELTLTFRHVNKWGFNWFQLIPTPEITLVSTCGTETACRTLLKLQIFKVNNCFKTKFWGGLLYYDRYSRQHLSLPLLWGIHSQLYLLSQTGIQVSEGLELSQLKLPEFSFLPH